MLQASVRFFAFATRDILSAIRSYKNLVGESPTIALIRPDFDLIGESDIVLRHAKGAASLILLSHTCSPDEYESNQVIPVLAVPAGIRQRREPSEPRIIVPKPKIGRPIKGAGTCPHCKGRIKDFNDLGFWYGWSDGVTPSYWSDLRLFIFARDNYTCYSCGSRRPATKLNAHHIEPKEQGGTDSARNLVTVCIDCHEDLKPIYDEPAIV